MGGAARTTAPPHALSWRKNRPLQCAREFHQVRLLWRGQLGAEDQIEELDRVVQRQQVLIVQEGRVLLDGTQPEDDRGLPSSSSAPPLSTVTR
jgi:hypothetical protein